MPKFSVVISVYNKQDFIAKTLESVLAQTFQDFEIIIRNDGSSDNSDLEILKFKDPRIKYYPGANLGAGGGRNFVIDKSKAPYIALLDADDYWYPFYLEEQNRLIEQYPEESIFATATELKRHGKIFANNYSLEYDSNNTIKINYFKGSFLTSLLHSSSTVIRKDVFRNIGYYDPSIKSGQDMDLYIRIGLNYDVIFSPRICAMYIIREKSLSQTTNKLADKVSYIKYEKFEAENPALKRFLDLNRYAHSILAILEGNQKAYAENFNKIDKKHLSQKQIFLLKQNRISLRFLLWIQSKLESSGIRLTSFK